MATLTCVAQVLAVLVAGVCLIVGVVAAKRGNVRTAAFNAGLVAVNVAMFVLLGENRRELLSQRGSYGAVIVKEVYVGSDGCVTVKGQKGVNGGGDGGGGTICGRGGVIIPGKGGAGPPGDSGKDIGGLTYGGVTLSDTITGTLRSPGAAGAPGRSGGGGNGAGAGRPAPDR